MNDNFVTKQLKNYWHSQEKDWSCGIASTRIILDYLGIKVTESSLLKLFKERKLKIFDFGILTPYIPIIFLKYGFKIVYRTNITYFNELGNFNNERNLKKQIEKILCNYSKSCLEYNLYMSLLTILNLNGKIIIHKKQNYPNNYHLAKNLEKKLPLIVGITAKNYYGINEEWNHTLALIPYNNRYWVQDPYELNGFSEYKSWPYYLNHSKSYNWKVWSDELIEIYP